MMVCTKSFRADYAGRNEVLTAGVSHATDDHELVKRYPQNWRAAFSKSNASRDRVYASGIDGEMTATAVESPFVSKPQPAPVTSEMIAALWRKRGGPRPKPPRYRLDSTTKTRLSSEPSRYAVRLASMARQDLIEDLRKTTARDGLEVGGALFGPRPKSWADVIEVTAVGTAGNALRWPRAIARDVAHDAMQADRIRKATDGHSIEIGYAHSHPEPDSTPSATDLKHCSQMRALLGIPTFVSIIATPDRTRGWDRPELTAWVVRSQASGHDVCERAEIIT